MARMKLTKKKMLNLRKSEIIRMLHKMGGAMSANELAKETGISYPMVIKELKELESWFVTLQVHKDGSETSGAVKKIIKKKKIDKTGKLRRPRTETVRYKLNYYRLRDED